MGLNGIENRQQLRFDLGSAGRAPDLTRGGHRAVAVGILARAGLVDVQQGSGQPVVGGIDINGSGAGSHAASPPFLQLPEYQLRRRRSGPRRLRLEFDERGQDRCNRPAYDSQTYAAGEFQPRASVQFPGCAADQDVHLSRALQAGSISARCLTSSTTPISAATASTPATRPVSACRPRRVDAGVRIRRTSRGAGGRKVYVLAGCWMEQADHKIDSLRSRLGKKLILAATCPSFSASC